MPDRHVTTIKDLIYDQYAKIKARSALHVSGVTAAKANHCGFIKQTFRELQNKLFTKGRLMQRKKQRPQFFHPLSTEIFKDVPSSTKEWREA
jgi:hypothetical protein